MTITSQTETLLKGCENKFIWINSIEDKKICGRIENLKHGEHTIYCPSCKSAISSRLITLKDELEFLKGWTVQTDITGDTSIKNRIQELKSSIKLLQGALK